MPIKNRWVPRGTEPRMRVGIPIRNLAVEMRKRGAKSAHVLICVRIRLAAGRRLKNDEAVRIGNSVLETSNPRKLGPLRELATALEAAKKRSEARAVLEKFGFWEARKGGPLRRLT